MSTPLLSIDEDDLVLCPNCGQATGLHFDRVDVVTASGRSISAHAAGEDDSADVTVKPLLATDPNRRHSIVLHWWCEHCSGGKQTITLQQHKGVTQVS